MLMMLMMLARLWWKSSNGETDKVLSSLLEVQTRARKGVGFIRSFTPMPQMMGMVQTATM